MSDGHSWLRLKGPVNSLTRSSMSSSRVVISGSLVDVSFDVAGGVGCEGTGVLLGEAGG